MNLVPVSQNNFSSALSLIEKSDLPTNDISEVTKLFVLEDGGSVVGTVGLEYDGSDALLRSLSVSDLKRGSGYGKRLVDFIEEFARKQGVSHMYLLTTTAADFFAKRGYRRIQRSEAAPFIQKSSEFTGICPASATIMKKQIG